MAGAGQQPRAGSSRSPQRSKRCAHRGSMCGCSSTRTSSPSQQARTLSEWAKGKDWFGRWMPEIARAHPTYLLGAHPDDPQWSAADGSCRVVERSGPADRSPTELLQCAAWYGGTGTSRDASAEEETCGYVPSRRLFDVLGLSRGVDFTWSDASGDRRPRPLGRLGRPGNSGDATRPGAATRGRRTDDLLDSADRQRAAPERPHASRRRLPMGQRKRVVHRQRRSDRAGWSDRSPMQAWPLNDGTPTRLADKEVRGLIRQRGSTQT